MLNQPIPFESLLRRIDRLGRELEQLKRDLLQNMLVRPVQPTRKPSLFGSVSAGDITDDMIAGTQRRLFRPFVDI
jgi:hypothetical protein